MKPDELVTRRRTHAPRSCSGAQSMLAFQNRMYEIGKLLQAARDKAERSSLPGRSD